jgi:hypothetical protein
MTALTGIRDRAISNAQALADDAQVLFHAGHRWAGAHYLATLAIEEVGKAWLCHRELCGLPGLEGVNLRHSHGLNAMAARQFLTLVAEAARRAAPPGPDENETAVTEEQASDCVELASFAARAASRMAEWRVADPAKRTDGLLGEVQILAGQIPTQVQRSVN